MKRVLSIQDISCIGKCSITVALPILSAAGVECVILPTAVLSAHTAFSGFTFRDLTEDIVPVMNHWKDQKIVFDGIGTGYLGTYQQIELVEELFTKFDHPGMLKFVDPAMGDNGKLYVGFDRDFALHMGELCGKADIIVPNLTEAAFMLGEEFRPQGSYDRSYLEGLLKRLCGLGAKKAVLTGVSLEEGKLGAMGYDPAENRYFAYSSEQIPRSFHGTGDVFSSACFGALMRGQTLDGALKTAVEYTVESIRRTVSHPDHNWYGVDFETALPFYMKMLKIR